MTKFLKKNRVFQWINESQTSFEMLKNAFTHGKIFQHFHQGIRAVLETDASNEAIRGCLLQADNSEVLRLVTFYSRKLTWAKRNYKIYDKEMLAIVVCLTKWSVKD